MLVAFDQNRNFPIYFDFSSIGNCSKNRLNSEKFLFLLDLAPNAKGSHLQNIDAVCIVCLQKKAENYVFEEILV